MNNVRGTIAGLTVGLAALSLTSGCAFLPFDARPRPRISNPRPDLDELVLVGFTGVAAAGDKVQWERSVQGQLLDIDGIDRIQVALAADDPLRIPAPGRAFLGLTVLHFDPYYPPEAIIEIALDVPAAPRRASKSVLELDREGRERLASASAPAAPLRFQLRVDADDARIAKDLVAFAHAQLDGDRGLDPIDRVLRDSGRFIDFVSYLALKESFRRLEGAADAEKGTDAK